MAMSKEQNNRTEAQPGKRASSDMVRLGRDDYGVLRPTDTLIYKKRGGGERRILPRKWWVNRNTPVGDDAELWERMPHDGKRLLDWDKLIGVERPNGTQRPDSLAAAHGSAVCRAKIEARFRVLGMTCADYPECGRPAKWMANKDGRQVPVCGIHRNEHDRQVMAPPNRYSKPRPELKCTRLPNAPGERPGG
jgi:hypothetical protein